MRSRIWDGLLWGMVMLILFANAGGAAAAPTADGPNLLQNPGFEAPYAKQCCHAEAGFPPNSPIAEVQVAWGWRGWWLQPGLDPQHPSAGGNPSWHRPEWREANCGSPCANRVRSGGDAQKYFTFWSVHDAGMYQQVSGITPGTMLRFSVYMQAWSTNSDYGPSNHAQTMGMRVGIDPFGGTDAFSPNIIWSTSFDTFDAWGLYSIEAAAQGGTVTVFTRSTPFYGNQHNDIYVDDASLVAINNSGGGNSQPVVPPVAPQPTTAPQPTATSTPVAGFPYVVQFGDNYYSIAQRFGVTLAQLYQANNILNPDVLFVGVVLIIPSNNPPPGSGGGQPNNPPPAPQPTVAPTALPTAVAGFPYVVQPGDNYVSIAQHFGVTLAQLLQANSITNPSVLFVGTVLIIPSNNPPPAVTPNTPPAQLPGAFAYTVQPGDDLYRIGLRFGISVARIKQLNGLTGDTIFVGQTLIIAP
jgi:LysM repeat protein